MIPIVIIAILVFIDVILLLFSDLWWCWLLMCNEDKNILPILLYTGDTNYLHLQPSTVNNHHPQHHKNILSTRNYLSHPM